MAVEWTGSGPDVLITLDRGRSEPLRSQLETGVREAIRAGRLRPDERLPSTRALATALSVSRGLVVECFDQLQAEGYLIARPGAPTRVSPTIADTRGVDRAPPGPAATIRAPLAIDFRPGVPDLGAFPREDWARTVAEVCRDVPRTALDYGEASGSRELRDVLASYLGRVRGADADPSRLLVATGFSQGLNLALAALAARGVQRVGFEDPGYDETSRTAAAWAGVTMVPVAVDDHGVDIDALAGADVQAVVVTPAHQWPTGVVLSPERRRALADWAAHTGAWVVEDDYDAEFRYDRDPVGAVQGLAPDRVINIGTVSKSLAPALRLGWLLCPAELVAAVADLKARADRGSPVIDQLVLARLLESGRFDRHLRRMRKAYAAKRDTLVTTMQREAPSVAFTGLAAGFHLVAHLPGEATEDAVVQTARQRGVGLLGMATHRIATSGPPQLVLGFGNLSETAIRDGIASIADVLEGNTAKLRF